MNRINLNKKKEEKAFRRCCRVVMNHYCMSSKTGRSEIKDLESFTQGYLIGRGYGSTWAKDFGVLARDAFNNSAEKMAEVMGV